jgi:hypothetical protein
MPAQSPENIDCCPFIGWGLHHSPRSAGAQNPCPLRETSQLLVLGGSSSKKRLANNRGHFLGRAFGMPLVQPASTTRAAPVT